MAFNPMNPISAPKMTSSPPAPMTGTRGLYPTTDGWVDINDDGTEKKLLDENSISGITPTVCSDINEAPYKTGWFISSDKSTMVLSYVPESTGDVLESLKGYQIQIPSNGNIKYRYFYTGSVIDTDQKSGVWQDYLFDLQNVVDKDGSEYTLDERDYADCNLMYDSSNGVGLLCKYSRGSAGSQSFYLRIDKNGISYKRSSANPLDQSSWEYITYTQEEIDAKLDGKVDKVEGKGLSSNDYTIEDKVALQTAQTQISDLYLSLNSKVDKVSGKGLSSNDFTNDEKGKLAGLPTSGELTGLFEQKINKVTAVDENSTDTQYPSAKAVYHFVMPISTTIDGIVGLVERKEDTNNKVTSLESTATDTQYPSAKAVKDYAEPKTTVENVAIATDESGNLVPATFALENNNKETRFINSVGELTFSFPDGEYATDYTEGLSFKSGTTPTPISYAATGIIQWIGTDCFISDDNKSVFKPSANMQYDIVFYYNGGNYIVGLVNGYKVATANQEAST